MKKQILAVTLLALALGTAACSSKAGDTTTAAETTAAETAAETTAAEESTEEEVEEDSMTGTITAVNGDILTIVSDGDDSEKDYDISNAIVKKTFDFVEGDQVYVIFPAESAEDPIPVMELEVEFSVIGENTDPFVEGIIRDATTNTITLEVDGEEYPMITSNAYVVAQDGITVDQTATVTYIGDLDDEPFAVKIVMEDSYDTPDAEINAFIGEVVQIEEDNVVLEAENGDFFTFYSDDIDFTQYSTGQTLQISYEGSITGKDISALEVTVK